NLHSLQRYAEAVSSYDQAIHLNPGFADAFFGRGNALKALKQLEQAIVSYEASMAINPHFALAYCGRGTVWAELEQPEKALADFAQALLLDPNCAEAYFNQGLSLQTINAHEAALKAYEQAIKLRPQFADTYYHRGNILRTLKQNELAAQSFDAAIALNPIFTRALFNRANTRLELLQVEGALQDYDHVMQLQADWAAARWNRSFALLLKGDFTRGWPEYEWRQQLDHFIKPTGNISQPRWLGDIPIAGKTILLHSEQGMGDTLQFCRYVPLVKAQGARVFLQVEPQLLGILRSLDGVDALFANDEAVPPFDYYCSLMSLPLACRTRTLADVPATLPYLSAPTEKIQAWQMMLGKKIKPRVGLVWSGGFRPNMPDVWEVNAKRNIAFELLARLNRPDIDFYSLQKGEPAELNLIKDRQQHWAEDNFHVLTTHIKDFSDTAALIAHLDLVISVDTSVLHLAAAISKPVWLLNRFDTCWRWMVGRDDSPWYPTLRLFRQPKAGDWDSVIKSVQQALAIWVTKGSPAKLGEGDEVSDARHAGGDLGKSRRTG
ncbi:MAG: tetratricopeptide repeat protein, partial [Methylophilaceae bacterium]|nr:tetratricopeptide repeat protein [Methylophilaceae bacterium]